VNCALLFVLQKTEGEKCTPSENRALFLLKETDEAGARAHKVKCSLLFGLQETEGEKCTPSTVSIILCITGDGRRKAHINNKSKYYFFYRRQKCQAHTTSSVYYFLYYRRERCTLTPISINFCIAGDKERCAHQDQVSTIVITKDRRRDALILTSVIFLLIQKTRGKETHTRTR
jgi:hypothetical protein